MRLVLPVPGSSQGAYAAYDAVRVAGAAASAEGSASNATAVGERVPDAAAGYAGALGSFGLQTTSVELGVANAYATWTVTRAAAWERMGLPVDLRCSVSLGSPNMAFGDVNPGGMTGSRMQEIQNTGTARLLSVEAAPGTWSIGTTTVDAVTKYRLSDAAQFKPLVADDIVARMVDVGNKPSLVEFQVDLSRVTADQDMTISQTINYTATCG